jgi:hypothetical protein
MTKTIDQYREPGTELFFEYHCEESHSSSHAEWWYRSHQKVTVLACVNKDESGDMTQNDRFDKGHQLVYKIRWADGFEGDCFEDELLDSEDEYQRPEPPTAAPHHSAKLLPREKFFNRRELMFLVGSVNRNIERMQQLIKAGESPLDRTHVFTLEELKQLRGEVNELEQLHKKVAKMYEEKLKEKLK